MKIGEAESWLAQQLTAIYDANEAANIADLVVEHLTQIDRPQRIFKKEEPLNVHQLHHLTKIEQRLSKHEPVQYVLGEAWFYGLKLFVDKHVLIPRPETEELMDWVVKDIKATGLDVFQRKSNEADVTTQLKVLDIGTGSGCIALALKNAMPKAEIWGCDISDEALNIARRNGSELNIRVDFQGMDLLDDSQQKLLPTVDIIISNPPYIPLKDKMSMHPNVLDHEPHVALFVPDNDALKFYKAILQFAKKRLYNNGSIYLEIHEGLGKDVVALYEEEGFIVELRKDMQGKDRMVKVTQAQYPKGDT